MLLEDFRVLGVVKGLRVLSLRMFGGLGGFSIGFAVRGFRAQRSGF